jgi:endonuclease YncB( thermonuclease family)
LTVVLDVDGQETSVRMLGVAPVEFGRPHDAETSSRGGQPDRPVPIQMFLENLLRGESVYVVYDSQVEKQDEDGKFVAYLYRAPDGLLINQEAIRQGFGVTDNSYAFEEQPSFRYYQEKAQKAKKGLWGGPQGPQGKIPHGPGPRPAGKPT